MCSWLKKVGGGVCDGGYRKTRSNEKCQRRKRRHYRLLGWVEQTEVQQQ
jgi:hypothetical protein